MSFSVACARCRSDGRRDQRRVSRRRGRARAALQCADDIESVRHFAFPEVFLGLFPAWGGTQLLPELVGPEAAIKVIVSNPLRQNRMLEGARRDGARHRRPSVRPGRVRRRIARVRAGAGRRAARTRRGRLVRSGDDLPACTHCRRRRGARRGARTLRRTRSDRGRAGMAARGGVRREEEAIGELLPGPQAQASIYSFQLVEQRAKKHPARPQRGASARSEGRRRRRRTDGATDRVALPQAARGARRSSRRRSTRSSPTRSRTSAPTSSIRSREGAKTRARDGSSPRSPPAPPRTRDSPTATSCSRRCSRSSTIKKKVFAELEDAVRAGCILATNTSALPIGEMAADLDTRSALPACTSSTRWR